MKNIKNYYNKMYKKFENKYSKTEINIGVEILRFYLSILVVNTHCYKNSFKNIASKLLINRLHVPTFFLIIPYIIWPIITFILYNLIKLKFKFSLDISLKDLKSQLLTGHSFNTVFWFQWNLIFETFIFIIVELIYHKYIIFILINLGLASYFFQYSRLNFYIFIF